MFVARRWLLALLGIALVAVAIGCGPTAPSAIDDDDDESSCGDDVCSADESCQSCALDCGECGWPEEWVALEREVLRLVNEARATGATCGGVPEPATHPLVWNEQLATAARLHSQDMAEQNYFSHTSLDGRSPWDRIADAGYTAFAVGENIAAGSTTAAEAFSGWMSSPGHCRNIMSSDANELGVGYAARAGSTWGHYWTQTFGRR